MKKTRREVVRSLKKKISSDGEPMAVILLLERSVGFGHKKLALMRCLQAEMMGIDIPTRLMSYCQNVAKSMRPEEIERVVRSVKNHSGVI